MQSIGLLWDSSGKLQESTNLEFNKLQQVYGITIGIKKEIRLPKEAIDLVIHFESLHDGDKKTSLLEPQQDPIGIWTVGYGIALKDEKGNFLKGASAKDKAYKHKLAFLTEPEYRKLLDEMLHKEYLPLVLKMIGNESVNEYTLGALTSFCYNCGTHYKNSKGVLVPYAIWNNVKTMNQDNLQKYWENSVTKAGGKVQAGLVRRRKAEAYLNRYHKLKFYF